MTDFRFKSEWINSTLSLQPKSQQEFSRIITDSRKVTTGDLFVALKGDAFDGHDFISKAIEKGATGILCKKGFQTSAQIDWFLVDDPLVAYRKLAQSHREQLKVPVICITGSVGKTTTKEFIAAILRARFQNILKTEASQNGFIGIPMTLLDARPQHDCAVIEVGIDEVGAMIEHLKLVQPTHTVLTAIGPEHLEKLIDIQTVTREEILSLEWTYRNHGTVVINSLDPLIQQYTLSMKGKNVFRVNENITYRLTETKITDPAETLIELPLPGIHNAQNLALGLTLAQSFGIRFLEARDALLSHFKGAKGRTEIHTIKTHQFILDHYNSNPSSAKAALQLFAGQISQFSKGNVILGDMLELGENELQYHRDLKVALLASQASRVYLYGSRMKSLADEMKSTSLPTQHFESKDLLASELLNALNQEPHQLVLLKGSRGMKMEDIFKSVSQKLSS